MGIAWFIWSKTLFSIRIRKHAHSHRQSRINVKFIFIYQMCISCLRVKNILTQLAATKPIWQTRKIKAQGWIVPFETNYAFNANFTRLMRKKRNIRTKVDVVWINLFIDADIFECHFKNEIIFTRTEKFQSEK